MNMKKTLLGIVLLVLSGTTLLAQSIAEKKAGSLTSSGGDLSKDMQKLLMQVNQEMRDSQEELHRLYAQIQDMYQRNVPQESYKELLNKVNQVKENIRALENTWREMASTSGRQEQYALWHQPETTIGQLINDYGSQSYIYVSTPEISSMKLSVDSNLPIPRSSWNEVLELILSQNGIGVKQLNPYVRELYLFKKDKSFLKLITNNRPDLEILPSEAKVAFVVSPEPSEVKRIWYFLDKFVNPNNTVLQLIGRDILIIGQVADVQDVLKIYDFVSTNRGDKEFKVVTLTRIEAGEMAKILGAIFDIPVEISRSEPPGGGGPPGSGPGPGPSRSTVERIERPDKSKNDLKGIKDAEEASINNGLKVIALSHMSQALFLIGTKEEIRKAEEIIQQVENQVGDARTKVIFWYTTKHSDPEELAQILQKVYQLMIQTNTGRELELRRQEMINQGLPVPPPEPPLTRQDIIAKEIIENVAVAPPPLPLQYSVLPPAQRGIYEEGYYLTDRFLANPDPFAGDRRRVYNQGRNNFLVDPKTGAIVMVVEADLLTKIKDLIRKLDVPKKMVQIEVLLFEKRVTRDNNIGLNLLQIGTAASQTNATSLLFNAMPLILPGITDFMISRTKDSGIPAYDATYRFLISRDDIQVNASPSVLTINQTPAIIEIEEEISVNTGIFIIQDAGTPTLKDSFARARYGIKILVTPTIHVREEDNPFDDTPDYVTLESDIKFETIRPSLNNRPDVTRRVVKNQASIPDGQTVIIGGLRSKQDNDTRDSIPYLGEIPGFGKLFSTTSQHDESVEMFIFITPKIIRDAAEDLDRIRCEEMARRPGDIPSFLCLLQQARELEKKALLEGTITMLFGRKPGRCISDCDCGEYDGR